MKQLLLGYDIGSSFVKASLVDADNGVLVASASFPEHEMRIDSPQSGWAEQRPETWWANVVAVTKKLLSEITRPASQIRAIGISYQMHGLVLIDKDRNVLRPSIIWCDSRAVSVGNKALSEIGTEYCLGHLLNAPGNFTASKLKWVKDHEPEVYRKVSKIVLPGDFIAMKLTGEVCTTIPGLSEGIFWDFAGHCLADRLLEYYDLERSVIPGIVPTFGIQGKLTNRAAGELGLRQGVPVSFRAGDQPTNAYSLNVLRPGEVAATAGTSGVIYAVTNENLVDKASRVNTFAHVNYSDDNPAKGVLLCINGTGIQYSWMNHRLFEGRLTYDQMNELASKVAIGCEGLICFPFGNGAERSLDNMEVNGHFSNINFNIHGQGHLVRAAQEGIAFSFRYGLDIMRQMRMKPDRMRVGNSGLFKSQVFQEAVAHSCGVDLEVCETDGAQGAARGAGVGAGIFSSHMDALRSLKVLHAVHTHEELAGKYESAYSAWRRSLAKMTNAGNVRM